VRSAITRAMPAVRVRNIVGTPFGELWLHLTPRPASLSTGSVPRQFAQELTGNQQSTFRGP
jgi:hypothetical protein